MMSSLRASEDAHYRGANMSLSKTATATIALALLVGIPPAFAQHGGGGGGRGGGAGHGGSRASASRGAAPRQAAGPHVAGPRAYGAPRSMAVRPRFYGYAAPREYGYAAARGVGPRSGVVVGHGVPRTVRPGVAVAPFRFYRPYYVFRPRFSLGFGLWAGFPVSYPYYWGYYDPYYGPYGYVYGYPPYAYPYPYPYPGATYPPAQYPPGAYPPSSYPPGAYPPSSSGPITVQPNQANQGGVSFEIAPGNAEVFVDGSYIGTADEFTPTTQPLGLTPGRHRIEIRASGYQTMAFDTEIVAGQVIPYQGTMQR